MYTQPFTVSFAVVIILNCLIFNASNLNLPFINSWIEFHLFYWQAKAKSSTVTEYSRAC